MALTSERTPRVASISSATAKATKSAFKSIPPSRPEHAAPEGRSPSTDSLFRLIAQCPSCAKIDFASISRTSSKTWGASTMAFTCTSIAECLPLPREELENYMRGNGKQPPPNMCPLGQFIHDALRFVLSNVKCREQIHVALNFDQYYQIVQRRTRLSNNDVDYRLSLFLEAPANVMLQGKLQWAIVQLQTESSKSRVILDSTMDIPPPRNGYLDVAADIGSYASYSITRNIRQHPLADQSVELIKRWLKECTQNHIECVVTEEPKLPARVVDIGLELDPKQPRLLVTNGQTGQYLAFSHCWGSKPLFRTLRSNIEQLQTRIPVQKLPRSFIDAIEVARILRIRYIWIDSLCIIQDDADDWEREAQKMGLIYENSQCTIAATSSDSSSSSFLNYCSKDFGTAGSSRSGQMYPQDYSGSPFLPLPYDGKDPARGSFYITQSRQKTDPLLNVSQAPLNTRGWVLQERLLSRRILHFAADQVYWECRSHALAQDGTVFRPKGPVDFLFPLPSLIRSIYSSFSNHRGSDEIFMRSWLHIIEFYSACNFTYEKDRLPALLGLADRLSRFTNREYINGHWFDLSSNVIPNTLLWTACGQITKISKKQLAPSWSWAAAEGEFSFESANVGIIPRILRLERSDTFGIPDFVTLHISCELCQAYPFLSLDEGQSRVKQIWESKYRDINWKPSTSVTKRGTLRPGLLSHRSDLLGHRSDLLGHRSDLLGHITFDSITNIPEVIDCMHLYCDRAGYTRIMALIPAKANNEATNVYQRVGIGSFRRGPRPSFVKKEIQLV